MAKLLNYACFLSIALSILVKENGGQRLSQGASDWYMRFHSNFRHVKRDVDPPEIKSFHISSTINHRYSITEVKTVIANPAEVEQEFQFGFVMAKTALISNITLSSSIGTIIKSAADASEWAHCFLNQPKNYSDIKVANSSADKDFEQVSGNIEADANGDGNANGHENANGHADTNGHANANGHADSNVEDDFSSVDICDSYGQNRHGEHISYLHHSEDFKQFVLPVKIASHSNTTLSFVYEYLLDRTDNLYTQTISANPGQLVTDFNIQVHVVENRPLKNVKLDIPALGEIDQFYDDELNKNEFSYDLKMNFTEQFNSFGQHGYTGDFIISYDLAEDIDIPVDLVTKDDFFVHFYNIPESRAMKSIPKHVTFLLDISESMAGSKLNLAKSSVLNLIEALDESHFITLITFDSEPYPFSSSESYSKPDEDSSNGFQNDTSDSKVNVTNPNDQFMLPCNNETYESIALFFENLTETKMSTANITKAIVSAIDMDDHEWSTKRIPENALSMFILLTDGRSASGNNSEIVGKEIRMINKAVKIPIFTIGVGFDANMEFLENIAETFCGRVCMVNIFGEFEDVENQLENVEKHLNNMVIKNLAIEYVGDVFDEESFTRNTFRAFHQGGAAAIAGQFDVATPYPEFKFRVSGQSASGNYNEESNSSPFVTNGCTGKAILCSSPNFGGNCIAVEKSTPSLQNVSFDDKTVSINVTGSCAWIAFDQTDFKGHNLTLLPGGVYGGLSGGPGGLYKSISSIRMVSTQQVHQMKQNHGNQDRKKLEEDVSGNTVARLWAFKTIGDLLERAAENEITKVELEKAYSLGMKYNFLTPFTVMSFVSRNIYSTESDLNYIRDPVDPQNITYGDLSPIFYNGGLLEKWETLKKCEDPIICQGKYHFEIYNTESRDNTSKPFEGGNIVNCTGSITLYTKSNYSGEELMIESHDIYQLYHETNEQKIRSIQTKGECCWNLFDKLFFSGNPNRICGDKNEPQFEKTIGSIKRNAPSNT